MLYSFHLPSSSTILHRTLYQNYPQRYWLEYSAIWYLVAVDYNAYLLVKYGAHFFPLWNRHIELLNILDATILLNNFFQQYSSIEGSEVRHMSFWINHTCISNAIHSNDFIKISRISKSIINLLFVETFLHLGVGEKWNVWIKENVPFTENLWVIFMPLAITASWKIGYILIV